jgi:hypothetical protein
LTPAAGARASYVGQGFIPCRPACIRHEAKGDKPLTREEWVHAFDKRISLRLSRSSLSPLPEWDELTENARRGLEDVVQMVDLPADDDKLWKGMAKLRSVTSTLLRDKPVQESVRWCEIALDLFGYCDTAFGADQWAALARLGRCRVEWPIYAAWYVWAQSGADTTSIIARLLKDMDWCNAAYAVAEKCQQHVDEKWMQRVLSLCEQPRD